MDQVNRFPGGRVWRFLAAGLGAGHIPFAPGTFGSLLALPLWYPDPSTAVIDEVCGMLLATTGIPWGTLPVLSIFLLFRLFDIVKFGPAAWMDAREGAVYVVADDLFAGFYANLAYRGLAWMAG